MLSPRQAHGFANNTDMISYDRANQNMHQTQMIAGAPIATKPSTAVASSGVRPKLLHDSGIMKDQSLQMDNFQNNFTGSKDKRLTMHPD